MEELSIFDLLPEEEAEQYKPKKSTDWKWTMAEDYPKEKNGLTVFSCFACGGGSTMGYKLAGCDVLGCCEIDPKMNEVYVANHHPKYNYLMDIRDFNNLPDDEIPQELFNLDILDGSPPCTTFSMAGEREDSWGKKKVFREGQKEQTLDDLSFVFIDTVAKLRPKVVIMENVEGLLLGEAFGYVQEIYRQFNAVGYRLHHWLLRGETMGVPQTRHRVIFLGTRKDIQTNPANLDMSFNYEPITYGEIKSGHGREVTSEECIRLLNIAKHSDKRFIDIYARTGERERRFGDKIAWEEYVLQTISATLYYYRGEEKTWISLEDIIHAQTFPEDYGFPEMNWRTVSYICGMSVPPIMIKRIVTRLIEQGVFDYARKSAEPLREMQEDEMPGAVQTAPGLSQSAAKEI